MKCYRKGLRAGVVLLFLALVFLHVLRGPPRLPALAGALSAPAPPPPAAAARAAAAARDASTASSLLSSAAAGASSSSSSSSSSGGGGGGSEGALQLQLRGAGAPASGGPRRAYKRRQRPIVYPSTCFAEASPDGGYNTYYWTDGFLKDSSIVIVSQCYVGLPRSYENIVLRSPLLPGGRAGFGTIHVRDAYESVIVASYEGKELAGLDRLELEVEYGASRQNLTLLRAPGGFESSFAMCALFLQDRHLLRMWTAYWYLLGVDTFYLYWNGEVSAIPELRDMVEDLPATVVFVHWPYDYWVPNKERPHHGQPQAWNSCYQRNRDKHDYLVFYDLVRGARSPRAVAPASPPPPLSQRPPPPSLLPPPTHCRRTSCSCFPTPLTWPRTTTRCRAPGWRCARGAPGRA
jgi:hypothetical protein